MNLKAIFQRGYIQFVTFQFVTHTIRDITFRDITIRQITEYFYCASSSKTRYSRVLL